MLPQGVATFRHPCMATLEAERATLTAMGLEPFRQRSEEFGALDKQLAAYKAKIEAIATAHPVCQRVATSPGVGPLPATAVVAAVSDARACKNGCQCAAWLGLVPRHHSTGGKARLLGSSKRGEGDVRQRLVHGARATRRWVGLQTDRRSKWVRALRERRGKNRVAGALANKKARIAWVLLGSEQTYTG